MAILVHTYMLKHMAVHLLYPPRSSNYMSARAGSGTSSDCCSMYIFASEFSVFGPFLDSLSCWLPLILTLSSNFI